MSEFGLGILACIGALIWAEAREWLPWLSKHVVRKAVLALPIESRERMEEELLAELLSVPGKISPLMFASSLWWGLWRESLLLRLNVRLTAAALRLADLTLASIGLFLVMPLLAGVTIAVQLATGSSGLVRKRCVGRHGVTFDLLRFDFHTGRTGKPSRWGTFAYRTGIDALPAYVNVIRGEMSLVGPPPVGARPKGCCLVHLKPGLVWNRRMNCRSIERYGETTSATVGLYFRLLWGEIRIVLFGSAPSR